MTEKQRITQKKICPRNVFPKGLRATGSFCDDVSDGDYYKYGGNYDDDDDGDAVFEGTGGHSEEEHHHFMC